MMKTVFFLGTFGVAPGLSAYLHSGQGGWRVLAAVWILALCFGAVLHFAPGYLGAMDDTGTMAGRSWVAYATFAVLIGQGIGLKAKGKAPQPAIGAGVAALGLAIGAGLVGFGVI